MIRYLMMIPETVGLVMPAGTCAEGGGIRKHLNEDHADHTGLMGRMMSR